MADAGAVLRQMREQEYARRLAEDEQLVELLKRAIREHFEEDKDG